MRKIFNFRVSDIVFKVIQHDMSEKKAGVTYAFPVTYKGKPFPPEKVEGKFGKTVCHKDDKFDEMIGIKFACHKSIQKIFSFAISEYQRKVESMKKQMKNMEDCLNSKIKKLVFDKTNRGEQQ